MISSRILQADATGICFSAHCSLHTKPFCFDDRAISVSDFENKVADYKNDFSMHLQYDCLCEQPTISTVVIDPSLARVLCPPTSPTSRKHTTDINQNAKESPLTDRLGEVRHSGVLKKMVTATDVMWDDRQVRHAIHCLDCDMP